MLRTKNNPFCTQTFLILLLFSLLTATPIFAISQEQMTQNEEEAKKAKENAKACVTSGLCDGINYCTKNRLCLNNCEIGDNPQEVHQANIAAALGFFGLGDAMEGNELLKCRRSCVAKSFSDCNEPIPGCKPENAPACMKPIPPEKQPGDYRLYEKYPATADPARICREYCGAWSEWPGAGEYSHCDKRCSALDVLSECFKKNKGAENIQTVCKYSGKEIGGEAGTRDKDALVQIKLNSFVQEATCIHEREAGRPDSDACKYLCVDKTGSQKEQDKWLRSCTQKTLSDYERDKLKQIAAEAALKSAVSTALQSATEGELAVGIGQKSLKSFQKDKAESLKDWEEQQKEEEEQALKEYEKQQKNK